MEGDGKGIEEEFQRNRGKVGVRVMRNERGNEEGNEKKFSLTIMFYFCLINF